MMILMKKWRKNLQKAQLVELLQKPATKKAKETRKKAMMRRHPQIS